MMSLCVCAIDGLLFHPKRDRKERRLVPMFSCYRWMMMRCLNSQEKGEGKKLTRIDNLRSINCRDKGRLSYQNAFRLRSVACRQAT